MTRYFLDRFNIFHRNGLAASGVVRHGNHAKGNICRASCLDEMRELTDVHISLEPAFGINVLALRRQQIHGLRAGIFDIRAGGIEMAVVGDDVFRLQPRRGQNTFGGPALVHWENMLEAGNLQHRVFETMPGCASRIAFISEHQRGPLACRHSARAAVG